MFEVATTFMVQLVDLLVPVIAIYIIFDFMGSLLFGKR